MSALFPCFLLSINLWHVHEKINVFCNSLRLIVRVTVSAFYGCLYQLRIKTTISGSVNFSHFWAEKYSGFKIFSSWRHKKLYAQTNEFQLFMRILAVFNASAEVHQPCSERLANKPQTTNALNLYCFTSSFIIISQTVGVYCSLKFCVYLAHMITLIEFSCPISNDVSRCKHNCLVTTARANTSCYFCLRFLYYS